MALTSYITNAGDLCLRALTLRGEKPVITRAVVGDGRVDTEEQARALIAPVHYLMDAELADGRVEGDWNVISVRVTNSGMTEAMHLREIALYCQSAEDPTAQVLFLYANFGENADWFAPISVAQYVRNYELTYSIDYAGSGQVNISPSGLVTKAELDAMTADDFGAVASKGGEIKDTVITFGVPESATVSDLTSGSATGTLMGRVKRLLTSAFDQIGTKAANGHRHEQADVKDLKTALDAKVPTARTINGHTLTGDVTLTADDVKAVPAADRGKANGVASLDAQTKVPAAQLPTIAVAGGGTGRTSVTSGSYLVGAGTGSMTEKTPDQVRTHIGAAAKPVIKQYTLTAAGWAGDVAPYTQTIAIAEATATSVVFVEYAVPLSEEQRTACEDGEIEVSGKTDTTVTIAAKGTKPAVDVPIVAVVLN